MSWSTARLKTDARRRRHGIPAAFSSGTNTAPVCEDGTLETYKNIANTGTLSATDQEDQELTYQLVKEPKRGTVELHTDGSFTYTPDKNKVGKDSFVFTATDPAGNVSNEACVKNPHSEARG